MATPYVLSVVEHARDADERSPPELISKIPHHITGHCPRLNDDVRFYIDLDRLLEVWDEMWLTPHVRDAWSAWLRDRGLID